MDNWTWTSTVRAGFLDTGLKCCS